MMQIIQLYPEDPLRYEYISAGQGYLVDIFPILDFQQFPLLIYLLILFFLETDTQSTYHLR